jgi:hypothetical protein
MVPIAHRFVNGISACPPDIRRRLHEDTVDAVIANLQQVSALRTVAAAFEASGIPWLCAKGPVAAAALYDESNLRPFRDIDVVIPLSDFRSACTSLIERGYRPVFDVSSKWQELLFCSLPITFVGEGVSGSVDLHWQLLPARYSFTLNMDEVWARKVSTNALGTMVCTLGPDDMLIFLCLHAAKHDWERLIWLVDIAAFIMRSDRLDWDAVAHDLEHTSRRTPLGVSLGLVEMLFGVDLPARISRLVKGDANAAALLRERIRRWQQESHASTSPWPQRSLYYRSMSQTTDRGHYWHDVLFRPTPLEWKTMPLPFSCRGAYYFLRPLRLIWKHFMSAF